MLNLTISPNTFQPNFEFLSSFSQQFNNFFQIYQTIFINITGSQFKSSDQHGIFQSAQELNQTIINIQKTINQLINILNSNSESSNKIQFYNQFHLFILKF
jgi:hypothetical protein